MEQIYKKVLLEKILYPYGARHVEDEFALLLCTDETGKSVKFKMLSGTVKTGDEYHVTYHTENDSKYGETNVIDSILEYDDLDSTVGIRKFISKITSGDIAKRISDKYGMKIIEVLNKEPDEAKKELKTVKGIGSARAKIIIDKYNEKKSLLAATLALGKYGFTEPQLKLIKNFYKDITKAVCAIQKNIYALTYIDGIKFHDIDKKALDLNYTCNDGRRMIAGLRYCFIQALDRYGWSYMREKQIYAMVNECKIPNFSPYVKSAINYMVEHKCINITGAQKVYSLSKLYNVEADIMRELYRIAAGNIERISDSVLQEHLDNLTTYNEDQLDFVKKAANSALSVVTGAAGTGKTYSVQGVVSLFKHEVCYGCALSGRAAANLKESLGKVECSTIHRAIPELMGNFGANNENFDNAKVIIVDESTMIDGEGVAEFIDLDIDKALSAGARYAVFNVYNFSDENFSKMEHAAFGFMTRNDMKSGKIFEPSTVKQRMDLASATTTCIPVIFDLKERVFVWCDMALTADHVRAGYGGINVESNLPSVVVTCKAMVDVKKPNLYDLFIFNAKARSVITDNPDEADVRFGLDDNCDVKPSDIDVIVGKYL